MPEDYLKKAINLIDKIFSAGAKADKGGSSALFKNFIRQFYLHSPTELLSVSDPVSLYNAAKGTWDFISQRKDKRKVRVFNPELKKHGWESERTIVELNVDDSPFIFDSITAEITNKGLRIYEVMHPVITFKRDSGGKITGVFDKASKNGRAESVMHFQISHLADNANLKILESDIANSLHFVDLTVSDWKQMMEKAKDVEETLDYKKLPFGERYIKEVRDFINWAADNNFIFLGYCEYNFSSGKNKKIPKAVQESQLGIFRAEPHRAKPMGLSALPGKSIEYLRQPTLLEITKSTRKSVVHRPVHMDYIGVKKFNDKGEVVGEHLMLGLFTSSVYYQSAKLIPIIREKIKAVVKRSGFRPDSHSGKALVAVLEGYPRDELLQISEADLFNISMGIVELNERPHTRLFVRFDAFSRFVSCIVFIPRDMFSTQTRQKVQAVLESAFKGQVTDYYTQVTESPLARVHVLIKTSSENPAKPNIKNIEKELEEITSSWVEGLRNMLGRVVGEREGEKLYRNYVHAFPESFKDRYHFGGTVRDIIKMEQAYTDDKMTLDLDLYKLEIDDDESYQLKVYHPKTQATLSNILPILENMGFHALDELTFFIQPSHRDEGIWVHHFRVKSGRVEFADFSVDEMPPLARIKDGFEEALYKIWSHEIGSDALNKLILRANINWRDITMLRAYSKYMMQISFTYGYNYVVSAIARHPILATLLVKLFHTRFSPSLSAKKRLDETEKLKTEINKKLANVSNVSEDRVIRQFFETILATTRTNYFQKKDGEYKKYISFKFDAAKIPNLPKPRPHAEIFVYSYDVEGVHLRGGKVARGGLRWSDRREDFRTEILGLVKAQMVKNSVIVPVGSKGGFVVKHPVDGDRDAVMKQGIKCYKTYLCGLLDITDNIIKGKIVPPVDVVRNDGDDPYLVVAADKGTATFSDIANSVAAEYNFWLGDAFASGGSAGYDHKKMGITARGAWVSVQRHFMEMGTDVQKEDFTVVGIGDMSGDVFGNGMLLSKHIKLVAAFNHMHIFIDPNPDSKKSWKERKGLFEKPRSAWSDYDKKLISKGGGIFERKAKTVSISNEIGRLFDINENTISPDELIKKILSARVDLIWNGGIGTYVKAEDESNDSVGDKANDALRVNAVDLCAKVVGEGGNLGFTQRARIEYSLKGGRINTDAIDNSGGVDCSDHEVNIKIALRKAMEKKKLTLQARDKLLLDMTDEVADLVLRDNKLQTQGITIAEHQSPMYVEEKISFMRALTHAGLLDRKIEFLPNDEELMSRKTAKQGLVRPEIAVLIAYSKIHIYHDLVNSNLPDDDYFAGDLMAYFPVAMRDKFKNEIEGHELRREIIATSVANSIVNRVGSTFFQRAVEQTGMKGCDIARAYIATRDAFELRELWADVENNSDKISSEVQTQLYLEISRLVQRTSSWFLRNMPQPLKVSEIVGLFEPKIEELKKSLGRIISPILREARTEKLEKYLNLKVPKELAEKIADLEALSSACDIVQVSHKHAEGGQKLPIHVVGEVYYSLGHRLKLGWLRFSARKLLTDSRWENIALQTITETLFDQQMKITAEVIKSACKGDSCGGALEAWAEKHDKQIARYDSFINDLKQHEVLSGAMLTVSIQRVEDLLK